MTDASLLDVGESTYRDVGDVELHVVAAGDPSNPLVVLLHGFPDFWYGWRHQIPALVEAGYRVLVPDQRGYNLSDKPEGLDAYRLRELSGDIAALVESEGRDAAHVVGHDWGGGVAWDLALRHPARVDRLAILNSPHPTVFRETLRSNPRQLLRSWYVFFFQVPGLPEWLLGRESAEQVVDGLRESSEAFSEADLAHYRAAFDRPGAVRGAVNWYRAAARRPEDPPRETVAVPTLVVWGDADEALVPEMATHSVAHCRDGHLERIPWATHWVHLEEPERVNDLLRGHLQA